MSDFEGQAAVDAADDETSVGTAVAMDDDYTKPRGWRHGATWTYLIMLLASAVALLVSFILSADTLKMARNPGQKLNCDVNAVLSCSTVAESWQAEIVKFAGLSFPNAFFGIAAESVFVTIAVIVAWLNCNACATAEGVTDRRVSISRSTSNCEGVSPVVVAS